MNPSQLLELLTVTGAGIVAGGQLLVLAAIIPARQLLPVPAAVRLHRESSRRIDRYMPATVAISALAAALLLIPAVRGDAAVALLIAGLVCSVIVGVLSVLVLMPTNRRIEQWPDTVGEPEFRSVFARWNRMHAARTVSAVLALLAYALAVAS